MEGKHWWQTAVIYQVYPRSFQDSDGDGVGDLRGIAQRVPYLADLGIDAIWISPVFKSPMADFGYDIADYVAIDPLFGTMDDFDALVACVRRHGLKLLLDLVPNHTSDQHPWFRESRSSRDSAKRDWYIWRDPAPGGGPPNNWMSEFGGSAWEFDEQTGQYFYHAFLKQQPDLNWRNPQVRRAVHEVMRFWLRKGVDGFRVDVIWHLIKDERFRNNPPNPRFIEGSHPPHHRFLPIYTSDLPEVHDVIRELRDVVDEFGERLLIGEIYLPIERLVAYYGRDLKGTHLPFNFALLETPWHAGTIAALVEEYEKALPSGGWPNWVLGNHDRPRIAARIGQEQARVAAMLLLTLRGTPTIYYGDEIGIGHVEIPANRVQDPFERNVPGLGLGRDRARTPMQWDGSEFAGFSDHEPWLPFSDDHRSTNVENQIRDPGSIYNLYRRLLRLRRSWRSLRRGRYHRLSARGDVLLFVREDQEECVLVALNFSHDPVSLQLSSGRLSGTILLSGTGDRDGKRIEGSIDLRPNGGLIVALDHDVDLGDLDGGAAAARHASG